MNLKEYAHNLGLDEKDFKELTDLFIKTTLKDLETLEESLKTNNFQTAREASHSIKGASGNLGFMDIWEEASKCEKACENMEIQIVSKNIETIKKLTLKLTELV